MGKVRRTISLLIGGIQCSLGVLASVFAYLVYADPWMRGLLAVTSEELYISMFLLLVFGIFSVFSGLLLVHKER